MKFDSPTFAGVFRTIQVQKGSSNIFHLAFVTFKLCTLLNKYNLKRTFHFIVEKTDKKP